MTTLTAYVCTHCPRTHLERPNRNPGHFCPKRGGRWYPLQAQPHQPEGDTAA